MPVVDLPMHRPSRATDAEAVLTAVPDMVEVVRFAVEAGRAPALVVFHRKISGTLRAQLRHLAVDLAHDV